MLRTLFVTLGIFLSASAALPARAAAESFNYLFGIKLGIAKIGEMRITGTDVDGRYTTTGKLYTTGLVGALYDVSYDYTAEGDSTNPWRLLPTRYFAKSSENGARRTMEILFTDGRVSALNATPARKISKRAAAAQNVVDPMTLIYLLVRPVPRENVCGGSFTLYDGGSVLDVSYVNPRLLADGRIACAVSYGNSRKSGGIAVSEIVFRQGQDGRMYVQEFSASTAAGTLKAKLQ